MSMRTRVQSSAERNLGLASELLLYALAIAGCAHTAAARVQLAPSVSRVAPVAPVAPGTAVAALSFCPEAPAADSQNLGAAVKPGTEAAGKGPSDTAPKELSDQAVADRITAEAVTAAAAERWQQVIELAKRALAVVPDHVRARELLVLAERELPEQERYERFSKSADQGDSSAAVASYREIGAGSRYHSRGAKRFDCVQAVFVRSFDQRAKALAAAKDCEELARIAEGVAASSLDAADAARKRYEVACAGPAGTTPEKAKTGDDVVFQWHETSNDRPIASEVLDWLARRLRSGTDVLKLEIAVTAIFEDADTQEARVEIAHQRGEWLRQSLVQRGVETSRIHVRRTVFTAPIDEEGLGSASFWLVKRGTKVEQED